MRTIARNSATVAVVCVGLSLPAVAAFAATPAAHACVGRSVSAAAADAPGFGQFVSGVAHDPTSGSRLGVGDDLQAVEAGLVPDSSFTNTCNG
jgi:hypothetical protein